MKLKHSVKLPNGIVIPAGTSLKVSNEGFAKYAGQRVNVRCIPSFAVESTDAISNNGIDPDSHFKAFDELVPGDMAIDQNGDPARILGKAVGPTGYNDLYNQFGNTSAESFDDLTVNMDDDEIAAVQFVAYSNEDGEVLIGIYGADHISVVNGQGANENGSVNCKVFDDVNASDKATTADGKTCIILAKGIGETWFKQTAEAFGLSAEFDEDNLPDGVSADDVELVLVKMSDGSLEILPYCPNSGACVASTSTGEASVEAIMAAAKRRWEKGGKQAYERMQRAQPAVESICVTECDADVRQNIQTELDNAGVAYSVEGDDIVIEDNDDNAEALAVIADTYPSVKTALEQCDSNPAEPSVEAIMAAAKRRWEKGGKQAYERMQRAQAAVEQICIIEDDDDVRQNIKTELDNAGIEYESDGDEITIEDNDDNAEALAVIADTYPSVKSAMSDAGIECRVSIVRQ